MIRLARTARLLAGCLVALTLHTGCSGTGSATPAGPHPGTAAGEPDETIEADATTPTDAPPTTSSITAPDTTTTTALVRPLIARKPLVTLVGPTATTDEAAPEFTWGPIDGATLYRLVVIDDDGPIWAWTGSATAVRLGGFDTERPTGFPGPDVTATTRWSVAALDATGAIIAISDARALAPAS